MGILPFSKGIAISKQECPAISADNVFDVVSLVGYCEFTSSCVDAGSVADSSVRVSVVVCLRLDNGVGNGVDGVRPNCDPIPASAPNSAFNTLEQRLENAL